VINCSTFSAVPFLLDIKLSSPIASLNHSGLDFFIFKTNDRSLEIHFADYPPTDLFDVTRFGRLSDTSDPSNNRYFRNQDNLPWALQINSDWRHPQEYIDIIWAYPAYENWVESSGTQSQDWHIYNGRVHHIY
jgi:LruC domain-containing protein